MDMTPSPPAAAEAATHRYTRIGTALLALAVAGPFLAALFGLGNAATAGSDTAKTLGALAFWALLAWLVTRKSSPLAKAKARTVVGVLLCLVAASHVANATRAARDEARIKDLVREALALHARQSVASEALARRFEQVPLAQALTPAGLATPQGLRDGEAALAQYRSLILERKRLSQQYLTEFSTYAERMPAGMRKHAETTFGQNRRSTEELLAQLDGRQTAHADAIAAIFSYARAQSGRFGLRGGQLIFQTEGQRTEFLALAARLKDTEEGVSAALAQAAKHEAKAQKGLEDAKALLAK